MANKKQPNLYTTYHRNRNVLSCSEPSLPIAGGNQDSPLMSIKRYSEDASSLIRSYGPKDGVWIGMFLGSTILIAVIMCTRTECAGSGKKPTPSDANGPTSLGILICMSCVKIVDQQEINCEISILKSRFLRKLIFNGLP